MEFRTGQEHGFARIWGHAQVVFREGPATRTNVEHALLSPEEAVTWLANVVDIQNGGATASGRVDAFLRPPGLPGAPPEAALDIDVPELSGTDQHRRARLLGLLARYTRAPSIQVRFWYTVRDPRLGSDRRIAPAHPIAHLLAGEAAPVRPPSVRNVRELEAGVWLRRPGRTRCGANGARDSAHGTLSSAQAAVAGGDADLCSVCFAPA
jgi:hypothetical protein